MSRHRLLFAIAGGVFCTTASADVLYDALAPGLSWYGDNFGDRDVWDQGASTIGGADFLGTPFDVQMADDFQLATAASITSVTADFGAFFGTTPSTMLVEIFADVGGKPAEIAMASITTSSVTAATLDAGGWGTRGDRPGYRVAVDLSGHDVELDAGTWWVSVAAVTDDWYFALRRVDQATGNAVHVRDGGTDHGNGFPGLFGQPDWTPYGPLTTSFPMDGDLSMRVDGTLVPTPGALGMIGLAGGLVSLRRRRGARTDCAAR